MNMILKLCGALLLALCAVLILREKHKVYALLISSAAAICVIMWCVGGETAESVKRLASSVSSSPFAPYAKTLLKALGIAYISAFTSELCRSCGEGMLASSAVLCGKVLLILLCLPLAAELLDMAATML